MDIACLEENIIRHKRDDSLATDTSTALELVNNIVENSSKEYDFITLMLPTCPLRTHQHIDTAFDLISGEDDGVISVTTYNFPIELKVTTDGEYIKLSDDSPLITGNTRSQNYQPALRPNGGFYIARWNFVKNKNFLSEESIFYYEQC